MRGLGTGDCGCLTSEFPHAVEVRYTGSDLGFPTQLRSAGVSGGRFRTTTDSSSKKVRDRGQVPNCE